MTAAEAGARRTWDVVGTRGVRLRAALWAADEPVAHVVLLQGRGDFLEKHDALAADLVRSGASVVSHDWRGQGRSARLGADPALSDVDDLDCYLADLDAVLADTTARWGLHGPRLVLAHSLGALVGALHLVAHPGTVKAAALMSPAWAFAPPLRTPLVAALAGLAVSMGAGRCAALGERPGAPGEDVAMATDDAAAQRRLAVLERAHPDAVVGGSTWRWARAAATGMRRLARAPLGEVDTDVLVGVAGADRGVDPAAAHAVARRFPRARVITYPRAGHELLLAEPETRRRVWSDVVDHLGLRRAGLA